MRTTLLTLFSIVLLSTALAASALGAINSPAADSSSVVPGHGPTERQVDGTPAAVPPVVLLPPTSGLAPVILPPTSGLAPVVAAPAPSIVRLPSTSTAPLSASLALVMTGAGVAACLTLLALGRRRN